jgi:hypothetical protein
MLRAILLPVLVHATLRTVGVAPNGSHFVGVAFLPPPKMQDASNLQARHLLAATCSLSRAPAY